MMNYELIRTGLACSPSPIASETVFALLGGDVGITLNLFHSEFRAVVIGQARRNNETLVVLADNVNVIYPTGEAGIFRQNNDMVAHGFHLKVIVALLFTGNTHGFAS